MIEQRRAPDDLAACTSSHLLQPVDELLPTLSLMSDYLQVSTTADSHETAARLASSAVAARLAAGAQVYGPVASFFWHQGELGEDQEWQVTLKTVAERYPELEAHLIAEHSWTNPEVTAVPLTTGSHAYLDWLTRMTAASSS